MPEVTVIGGGPAGFAAARALVSEKRNLHVTIFERQPIAGGVWNYTADGPMYRNLETNVPKEFMGFKDYPLPAELPTYVKGEDIAAYFQRYSAIVAQDKDIDVEFNANVLNVTKENGKWTVHLADGRTRESDFLLVASGHYEHPSYANIPGIREYQAAHPDRVIHSLRYDEPEPFANRSVLVIGNASSGVDLAIQLLSVTNAITISRRTPSKSDALFEGGSDVVLKPAVDRVDPVSGEVEFSDGTHATYDRIIVATGYQWRYPFLSEYNAQQKRQFLTPPEYHRLQNLHHYIFFIDDPSLAFVMINRMIVPVPWVESQAAVVARVWSGRLQLPSANEMADIDARLIEEKGAGEGYLTLAYPEDQKFMNIYSEWVDSLEPDNGFYAEKWDPAKLKRRELSMAKKFADFQNKVANSRALRQARTASEDLKYRLENSREATPVANESVGATRLEHAATVDQIFVS